MAILGRRRGISAVKTHALQGNADADELRRRAESLLQAQSAGSPDTATSQQLLHEVQVHQIELEFQNEELQQAQARAEAALKHFFDFYEFSPLAFLTVGRDGAISRVNLAGARLFGLDRSGLIGRRFGVFVAEAARPAFVDFLQGMIAGEAGRNCELALVIDGRSSCVVQISATLTPDREECHIVVVDVTERQQAADLLRESGQFNAQVIDNAQEGIVVYGPDLRYRVWNAYMENFTGMRSSDVLGRHPLEVFPFLKDSGVMANLERALAGAVAKSVEFPFEVRQTGRSGWAVDRTSPLRNARGEIIGVIGTVGDITEQKRAQGALNASYQFNRRLVDSMQDGFSAVDLQGVHMDINPALCRMTGFSREEIIGSGVPHPYWPPEDYESIQAAIGKVLNDEIGEIELIYMRKNGERFPVLLTPAVIRDEAGRAVSYTVTVKDITERRQAEVALKAFQQRFRDIVNTTDGIVWEADAQTFNFTFVSNQAERLLGYPVSDWLQPGFWVNNLHPDDREWASQYCMSCTGRLMAHDFEYRFVASDGRTVWLHDIVTVVAENGAPRWLRGIMVDITRRRQTEEKLVSLTESLEARVVERTKELRRVSAQLAMIEERERRMLAEDLHDNLGQLLAVIKIKLTSLSDDAPQTSIRQVLELLEQADRAARSITQQLSPPILKTLGLAPALEWLGDEIERLYGLRVHTDLGECSRRLIDEMQAVLYRSTRELLINVAKHAGVKEACLTCLCSRDHLVLVVSDAGCGFMPDEHFGALSGQNSFGLRSLRERIVNLGGELDIDSSPGNGTTITLSVPRIIEGKEICDDPNNACR